MHGWPDSGTCWLTVLFSIISSADALISAAKLDSKRLMKNSCSMEVLVAPENSSIMNWFFNSPYFCSIGQRMDLVNDLELMGLIFENLCVRDLRIYADALDGNVYHYRDKTYLVCDAVIHLRNRQIELIQKKCVNQHL